MAQERENRKLTPHQIFIKLLISNQILNEGEPKIMTGSLEKISVETIRQGNRDILGMAEQDLLAAPQTLTVFLSQIDKRKLQLINTFESPRGSLKLTLSILGPRERQLKIEYNRIINDLFETPFLNLSLQAHINDDGNFIASLRKSLCKDSSQPIFQRGGVLSATDKTIDEKTFFLAETISGLFEQSSLVSKPNSKAA